MKATSELNLRDFDFWRGAKQHNFDYDDLNNLESTLESIYPDGMSETQVNDLFWFDEEFLCECIGLDYNEYSNR